MTERQVSVTVFRAEQYDGKAPFSYDTKLVDVIAWFQQKLEEIPEQYRANAVCEIGSTGGYEGSTYWTIEITYDRPETASERGERIAAAEAQAIEKREREIAAAKATLARYGTIIS